MTLDQFQSKPFAVSRSRDFLRFLFPPGALDPTCCKQIKHTLTANALVTCVPVLQLQATVSVLLVAIFQAENHE